MKENKKVINVLKITSIFLGFMLCLTLIFLVVNESFALFTSKTEKKNYSFRVYKEPLLMSGADFQEKLVNYKDQILTINFQKNADILSLKEKNLIDVSKRQNRAVVAYLEENTSTETYTLNVVTEADKIILDSNSQALLAGKYSQKPNNVFANVEKINNLNILDTKNVTNMSFMFQGLKEVTSLDLSNFDTSNVTSMANLFFGLSNLESLNLSSFNTSKVIHMGSMFSGCKSLTSLDLSNFDTSKVTHMGSMFSNCLNLAYLNISTFNTNKVTNMGSMFYLCKKLENINIKNMNTLNVTDMSYMFASCTSLTKLDVTSLNTSKVENMQHMFAQCTNLESIDVSNFNTSNVTNMSYMFNECNKLTSLDLSTFNTKSVIYIQRMLRNCQALESITFGENFTCENTKSMDKMFYGCSNLTTLDLSNFDLSSLQTTELIDYCTSNLAKYTSEGYEEMFANCTSLTKIYAKDNAAIETLTEGLSTNSTTVVELKTA